MNRIWVSIIFVLFVCAMPASAELQWCEGRWQLELAGSAGIHSGGASRSGDYMLKALVEYETPFSSRCTLGLRLLPLFVYDQDCRGADTVWGAGVGLGVRVYSVANEYRGWFAEGGVHALGHKNRFAGNSSNINFLTGVGAGYKCKAGWHGVLRWEHISNANLGSDNSGANVVTLGVGYAF